jgi:hypothetical protein
MIMSRIDRGLIKTLAFVFTWQVTMLVAILWFGARANGGTLTIMIDEFDEAGVEYLLWLVVTPLVTLGLYYVVEEEVS